MRRGSAGSTVMALIAPESRRPIGFQVRPPSLLRYSPVPSYVMLPPPGFGSPVPTYSVPSGAVATAPMAWVQLSGHTEWNVSPASVLRHSPPLAAAAYRVSARFGSSARETIRPPMLVGPTPFQRPPTVGSSR